MKSLLTPIVSLLAAGTLLAPAQSSPKLALAGVTTSAAVAKKFNVAAPANEKLASQPVDLTGVWNGSTHSNGKVFPFVMTVTKTADGSQYAELKNIKRGNDFHSTSVACKDAHVTITFNDGGKSQFLDGRLDPGNARMQMSWNNGDGGHSRLVLEKAQMMSSAKQTGGTVAPVVSLDAITHALEVQLADRFGAEHSFSIMEEDDLRSAIPLKENEAYNLKNVQTAQQFRQAGINYLLLTSIEDVKNETVDKAQGRVAYETANGNAQSVKVSTKKEAARAAAHSAIDTQGKFDAHRVIQQSVYLLVRCRLFNAATGELLDSASHTFNTNRTYIVLAEGSKEVSASDLFEVAARSIADRVVARERAAVFPVTVVEKNGKEITINRGADAGLKSGEIFDIYASGKELKDPATGESLGFDEKLVGRVSISELQPKFSKAKVWEDNGIAAGNFLRGDK
jgi:hypothetical protein